MSLRTNSQKTVLITGGSSGIGRELARVFAQAGHSLILIARSKDSLEQTAYDLRNTFGVTVDTLKLDLARPQAGKIIYDWVESRGRVIWCLVNNVGIGNYGKFSAIPLDKERELLELNIALLTELCHRFIPHLKKHGGGKILNVASLAAFQPGPYLTTYYASKAYVLLFSEALTYELKNDHIQVTALCPGPSPTNFFKRANLPSTSKFLRANMTSPQEIAEQGYEGLMKNKTIIIPSFKLRIVPWGARLFPRSIMALISKHLVEHVAKG